jgi:hypothetical protein
MTRSAVLNGRRPASTGVSVRGCCGECTAVFRKGCIHRTQTRRQAPLAETGHCHRPGICPVCTSRVQPLCGITLSTGTRCRSLATTAGNAIFRGMDTWQTWHGEIRDARRIVSERISAEESGSLRPLRGGRTVVRAVSRTTVRTTETGGPGTGTSNAGRNAELDGHGRHAKSATGGRGKARICRATTEGKSLHPARRNHRQNRLGRSSLPTCTQFFHESEFTRRKFPAGPRTFPGNGIPPAVSLRYAGNPAPRRMPDTQNPEERLTCIPDRRYTTALCRTGNRAEMENGGSGAVTRHR